MPAGTKDSGGVDEKGKCPFEMDRKGSVYAGAIRVEFVSTGLLHTAIEEKGFVPGSP
jgi:hypothetical protein